MLSKLKTGHWPIFLLSCFSAVANLYLPIFLSRTLSPDEMGIYKIFFLHLSAIPFLFLTGGPVHSVYYWAGKDKESQKPYLQQSYLLALALSSLILLAGFPLQDVITDLIKIPKEHVAYMLLGAFLTVPADFYGQAKIALGSTIKGSLYDTFFEVCKVACFIYIAYTTKDIGLIFASFCMIFGLKFLVSIGMKAREGMVSFPIQKDKLREIFGYCLPISLAGLVTFFVDKMDQFVLAAQLPSDQFAFYSMGCLIIPPLYLLEMSVTKVLIPKLSRSHLTGEKDGLPYFRKAMADTAFLLVPAFCGLWIFAEPIVEMLYTEKFIKSAEYLRFFAVSYLFLIIPYDSAPRATGKTGWIFKLTLVVGMLSLAGVLLASKYFGALETLWVALFFKFAARAAGLLYSAKIMDWKVASTVPWKKIAIFTLASALLSWMSLGARPLFQNSLKWFLICAPIFAGGYFLLVWIPYKKGALSDS